MVLVDPDEATAELASFKRRTVSVRRRRQFYCSLECWDDFATCDYDSTDLKPEHGSSPTENSHQRPQNPTTERVSVPQKCFSDEYPGTEDSVASDCADERSSESTCHLAPSSSQNPSDDDEHQEDVSSRTSSFYDSSVCISFNSFRNGTCELSNLGRILVRILARISEAVLEASWMILEPTLLIFLVRSYKFSKLPSTDEFDFL